MDASTGAWEVSRRTTTHGAVFPSLHPDGILLRCISVGSCQSRESYLQRLVRGMWAGAWKSVERYLAGEIRWITLAPMRADGKFIGASVVDGCLWAVTRVERAILLDKYDPSPRRLGRKACCFARLT